MSRWHESGCKHPDVVTAGGLPCCNYCFAVASTEERPGPSMPPLPAPSRQQHMNLTWPSAVQYSLAIHSSSDGGLDPPVSPETKNSTAQVEGPCGRDATIFRELNSGREIRLLRVNSGRYEDLVHAHIEPACLGSSSLPAYDALSYTWADESGDCTKRCPIFIGSYWDVVYVTQNCQEALRSIRYREDDRLIWIDCLCINQENADEKTHQSALLRDIYMTASTVIVYLGRTSAESDMALDFLRDATTRPSISGAQAINPKSQAALQSLFHRSYFSRLWPIQEVVLAQKLEIVCGQRSVLWPNRPSMLDFSSISAPSWFFDRTSWYGFTGRGLLRLLLDATRYKCSDPRDKVFGLLGLLYEEFLRPDYRLSVESVYTGVTAYLIKNCFAFEVLALAGNCRKDLKLPSWVPDWSQELVQIFPDALLRSEEEPVSEDDYDMGCSVSLDFDDVTDSEEPEIKIDANTGTLQIPAVKLCDVSGATNRTKDKKILIPVGQHGNLIISYLDPNYQLGPDAIFLLNGWDHPVILRRRSSADSYAFISVCTIFLGSGLSEIWRTPWDGESRQPNTNEARVAKFTREEKHRIVAFYSALVGLCGGQPSPPPDSEPFSVIKNRFLDFSLLLRMRFQEIEARLRSEWVELDQRLGWMFTDRIAMRKLVQDQSKEGRIQESRECRSGKGRLQLQEWEQEQFKRLSGDMFSFTYEWDISRFCWSFIQRPALDPATDGAPTPVYHMLQSKLPEIRRWAEVTEQLLKLFNFSNTALASWSSFPGSQLSNKWRLNLEHYLTAARSHNPGSAEIQPLESTHLWNWSEFKDILTLRQRLWDQPLPRRLDSSANSNLAMRLGLKSLGLELESQVVIDIM